MNFHHLDRRKYLDGASLVFTYPSTLVPIYVGAATKVS